MGLFGQHKDTEHGFSDSNEDSNFCLLHEDQWLDVQISAPAFDSPLTYQSGNLRIEYIAGRKSPVLKILNNLTGKKDDYIEALSRSMKQRLCFAKTLIHDPRVLLLDDPASGLDPRARIEMRELLKKLRNMGKAIIISSHILTELADFCNTIGIVERGGLLAQGPVESIMEQLHEGKVIDILIKGDTSLAEDTLIRIEGVNKIEIDGEIFRVHVDIHMENIHVLIEALISKGIKVSSFSEVEIDLGEIFLKITKGEVQ
jgi:ABC-2 type transport system ATP-binding protein